MKMLSIKPTIYKFKTAEEFAAEFKIGAGDLVITNEYIYQPFFGKLNLGCDVLYQEKYGAGEPSDDMAEAMYKDIKGDHKRVIAIGGGTVIDISKLFALKTVSPILDLYDGKTEIVKDKELVLVPTTCGTGSEATCNAIVAIPEESVKKGIVNDAMIPDYAVLDPLTIRHLPKSIVAATGVDALAHVVECYTSLKATDFSNMFAMTGAKLIFKNLVRAYEDPDDMEAKTAMMLGAFYGGVAITASGTTAVHALSYPLGGKFHIAHGVSNAILFAPVMRCNRPACEKELAQLCDAVYPCLLYTSPSPRD